MITTGLPSERLYASSTRRRGADAPSPLWRRRFRELDHLAGPVDRPRARLDLVGAVIDLVADITQEIGHLAVVLDRAAGDVAVKQPFQVTLEADNVEHAGLPNGGLPPAG